MRCREESVHGKCNVEMDQVARIMTGKDQVQYALFAKTGLVVQGMIGATKEILLINSASWASKTVSITTGMDF